MMRLLVALLATWATASALAEGAALFRLLADAGEPRGHCLDVQGAGEFAQLDAPLLTHTCKFGLDTGDQEFSLQGTGQLHIAAYDRCVTAQAGRADAELHVKPCSGSGLQRWILSASGALRLAEHPEYCLTIGGEAAPLFSPPLYVPEYRARLLSMQPCRDRWQERQRWRWASVDEQPAPTLNTLRRSIVPDPAALSAAGPAGDAPVRLYSEADVTTTGPVDYGAESGRKATLHAGANRRFVAAVPVVLHVHDGTHRYDNIPMMFAYAGFVGFSAEISPDAALGKDDLEALRAWMPGPIAQHGGNDRQVFVVAASRLAAPVLGFASREENPAYAGMILLSPELPDSSATASAGTPRVPLLVALTEFDPVGVGASFAALLTQHLERAGSLPTVIQMAGHGPRSAPLSVGTADRRLLERMVDFICQTDTKKSLLPAASAGAGKMPVFNGFEGCWFE